VELGPLTPSHTLSHPLLDNPGQAGLVIAVSLTFIQYLIVKWADRKASGASHFYLVAFLAQASPSYLGQFSTVSVTEASCRLYTQMQNSRPKELICFK
jgi:hypothetical protein